jgi:hypothetical protein
MEAHQRLAKLSLALGGARLAELAPPICQTRPEAIEKDALVMPAGLLSEEALQRRWRPDLEPAAVTSTFVSIDPAPTVNAGFERWRAYFLPSPSAPICPASEPPLARAGLFCGPCLNEQPARVKAKRSV